MQARSDRAATEQGSAGAGDCAEAGTGRRAAASVATQPSRPRLVRLLRGRHPDRIWTVHCGLSDHAKMDADRHWIDFVGVGSRCAGGADARRLDRRRRAIRAVRRRRRDRRDRHRRPDLCVVPDLSGGARRRDIARGGKLRARTRDRRHQPRSRRSRGHRRAPWPQCPLRVHRQRPRGRRDGRDRALLRRARGVHHHRRADRAGVAGASPDQAARNRRRARAWRRSRTRHRDVAQPGSGAAAQAAAADLRRLHHAVSPRQRRHAAADGRRLDHAVERMGDGPDRGLHRGAANHRRADFALGRTAKREYGGAGPC